MSAHGITVREHPDAAPDALTIDRAIAKLRDEITAVSMILHGGANRELSFVMAKLDEAELWAIRYLQSRGAYVIVDKRRFLTEAPTETTEATPTGK